MRRAATLALAVGVFLAAWRPITGQIPPHGGAAALAADLSARRAATMRAMGQDAVLILWSASPRVYSTDVNYEFRQESNLLYLTGVSQSETILVLVPGLEGGEEHLFISAVDPMRELWEGRVLRPEEAAARTGIAGVSPQRTTEAFDRFIDEIFGTADLPGEPSPEFEQARAAGRLRLFVLDPDDDGPGVEPHADPDVDRRRIWTQAFRERHPDVQVEDVNPVLRRQRSIKTPYEQDLLRRSVAISAEAHIDGMRATWPGRWEYEVEAAIEYAFHRQGALSWGYPSIVASGPNANILHYLESTRQMQAGDLLLVDAAANYQGLTGDITRTYPVSGRFTAEQRELYDLVLRALEAGTAAARPGGEVSAMVRAVVTTLGAGLLELGLVTDPAIATGRSSQVALWVPHGPTHGIGIDVHDPLFVLDPGTAFVIEPGIYIRPEVLERLEADPETRELADQVRPAAERYMGIGIRVEDSFLMTPDGPENLSAAAPREADAVEQIVGTAR